MIPAFFAASFVFAPMQFADALAMTFSLAILIAAHFAALMEAVADPKGIQ